MLTVQENERLTRVGPGTPMGEFLRRYWWPVAPSGVLKESPTHKVRLLGEDLVLYRDKSGTLGLIGKYCAHRRLNLLYGMPQEHGLRCPYHGWLFDETGQCIEQPFEETVHPDGRFKEKIRIPAYPVQELGGLIWAYLGPEPVPLLPRWDLLVVDNVVRQVGVSTIPCNWLQIVENALDPVHVEWLHGHFMKYVLDKDEGHDPRLDSVANAFMRPHQKIGFDVFEHGIIKRRVVEGLTEEDEDWRVGHPLVFPALLRVGGGGQHTFQMRTPVDDTTTVQHFYTVFFPPEGGTAPPQDEVPWFEQPIHDERGNYVLEVANSQDIMAWIEQGPIMERDQERLGESDRGIILFRKMLAEQMAIAEAGGDPMNVFRDPEKNVCIRLPQEENKYKAGRVLSGRAATNAAKFGPALPLIEQMYASVDAGS